MRVGYAIRFEVAISMGIAIYKRNAVCRHFNGDFALWWSRLVENVRVGENISIC